MPRFPRNVGTSFIAQRAPRSRARGDRQFLALHDAGHGSAPTENNPILWGLGGTLEIQLNPFVRTWSVFIEGTLGVNTIREEITSFFTADPDIPRRWKAEGTIGVSPLGLTVFTDTDYSDAKTLTLILQMTNVRITTEVRREIIIRSGVPVSHCPVAEDCDFELFEPINRRGIRIFENMVRREWDTNAPVSFMFTTMDILHGYVPELTSLIPFYDQFSTVGIEFHNDGTCGPQPEGGIPTGCDTLDCCCSIVPSSIHATYTNESQGGASITPGVSQINTFDVIEIILTIPTTGGANCVGFESLQITLPGLDTTGGKWNFFDPIQPGGFNPVVTLNGLPVSPTLIQDGVNGGSGSGNSAVLDFSVIPIECGQEIQVTFRMYPVVADPSFETYPVLFNEGGPCFIPEDVKFALCGFDTSGDGGSPPYNKEVWNDATSFNAGNWDDTDNWTEES